MKLRCIILCGIIASVYCENYDYDTDPTQECKDFCILAMGLSGSGVFSTVQKLMSNQILKNATSIPTVTEYSWNVVLNDGKSCKIRIAVSPGQIEGRDSKHDAKTLATIKEYIESSTGLQGNSPSVVLVISRFDDIGADGANSKFVRLLKYVEELEPLLGYSGTNSNIIFHFTHLMARNRNDANNPNLVIQGFKNVIRKYTRLPDPVYVTIGENRPDDYQLPRRGAFIRLPNGQLYPRNIIDEILKTLQARSDNVAYEVVQEAFKDPYRKFSPEIQTFSVPDEPENEHPKIGSDEVTKSPNSISTTPNNVAPTPTSSTNFVPYTSTVRNIETESEINEDLRTAYGDLDTSVKQNNQHILQLVQNVFKRENITSRTHLPKTKLQTAALFQKLPFHSTTLALVQKAFQLQQPPFIHPALVGYGYDILKDETVKASPFILKNLQPTPIGYSLPNIYMCTKENETFVETFKLVESYGEFQQMWLKDLGISELSVNFSAFAGPVRSGYNNIKPNSDAFVAITAIQQIRDFKLKLILHSELNENFISDVNELTPFNQHDRESEREWNAFFRRYGTHVITEAFGGGYMEGKATGAAIRNNLNNKLALYDIKDILISFVDRNVSRDIETSHSFFGGAADAKMANMNKLPENERDNLFKEWRNSVRSDPRILDINIRLTPISEIASSVNETISQEIENSLNKLLQGNLVYQRRRNKPKRPNTDQTQTNGINSTTTKPLRFEQSSNRLSSNEISTLTSSPISVRNNNPKKEYNKNFIGQGYFILKDSVLPNSPFGKDLTLKIVNRVKVPNGVDVKTINVPCIFMSFKKFSSFSDYVKHRIYSIYKPTASINLDVDQYEASIKPGYNVIDGDEDGDDILSVYKEKRYFQVTADFRKLNLSNEFLRDVNQLQSYINNVLNCTVKEQWRNFFGKYGTHVVKAGYAGTWTENREAGIDTRTIQRKIGNNLDKCEPFGSAMHPCNYEDISSFHPKVTIHSATLETMKNAVVHFNTPWSRLINDEYHMVMVALLENRLKGCG